MKKKRNMKKMIVIVCMLMGIFAITNCSTIPNATERDRTLLIGRITHFVASSYTREIKGRDSYGFERTVGSALVFRTGGVKIHIEKTDDPKQIVIQAGKDGLFFSSVLSEGLYKLVKIDIYNGTLVITPNNAYFNITDGKVNNLGTLEITEIFLAPPSKGVRLEQSLDQESVKNIFKDQYARSNWNDHDWINVLLKNAESYFISGNEYYAKSEFDRAIADYTEAIQINPNYAEAYGNRGITYAGKKDYNLAIADLTEAIRLNNESANRYWYYNRGLVYYYRGVASTNIIDYDHAINDFEKVLEIDPNDVGAKQFLEIARRRRGY